MSGAIFLYAFLLLVAAVFLWGVYRVLGQPTRLAPADYTIVLIDVADSALRAAARLRAAAEAASDGSGIDDVATGSRKIFQTGYYQALRLRPTTGADTAVDIRHRLAGACEACDWASRMMGSESNRNPEVLKAARQLLDSGEADLRASIAALRPPAGAPTGNNPP
jgi:hypothetical protein